jgi:CxxC motif-containing protein (DUF1111 family)
MHPLRPDAGTRGLDLTPEECDGLVAFVRGLRGPAPAPTTKGEDEAIAAGGEAFATAGCAACHRPKLGDVEGIYSDLLLHNLGPLLADAGSYSGVTDPDTAGAPEWRTPPLWGVRDSGPYLHDGRAETLDEAVAEHGGEARRSAIRYFELPPQGRLLIRSFLRSLTVPDRAPAARAE